MSRATDTLAPESTSPHTASPPSSTAAAEGGTSLFEAEVRVQLDRAAADLRHATVAGDSAAAETAAARLADLAELHQRHHEPRRVLA